MLSDQERLELLIQIGRTIVIDRNYKITKDIEFPEDVDLEFREDGKFIVSGGATVFIYGEISANFHQIFDLDSLAGTIKINSIKTQKINPYWFGAAGDRYTDDTEAFKHLMNATRDIYIPKGKFLIKEELPKGVASVIGESRERSQVFFQPPEAEENQVLFNFAPEVETGSYYYHPTIKNIDIHGGRESNKTAIRMWHAVHGVIDYVKIFFNSGQGDHSTESIGLELCGASETSVANLQVHAARPILASRSDNPNARNGLDHVTFHNVTLYHGRKPPRYPLVQFDVGTTQVFFTGRQVWVGGNGGFLSNHSHNQLTLENMRWESGRNKERTNHSIQIVGSTNSVGYPVSDSSVVVRNARIGHGETAGVYIRNFSHVTLQDISSSPADYPIGNMYDLDGSCIHVGIIQANGHMALTKIGPELKRVFAIGGSAKSGGDAYTAFYTSTRRFTGGARGKPYVALMDSLYWTHSGNEYAQSIQVTTRRRQEVALMRVEVDFYSSSDPSIYGCATYSILTSNTEDPKTKIRLIKEECTSGLSFADGKPNHKQFGIYLYGYHYIRFMNRIPGTTHHLRVFYYPQEEK